MKINIRTIKFKLYTMAFISVMILTTLSVVTVVNNNNVNYEYKNASNINAVTISLNVAMSNGLQAGQALRNVFIDPNDKKAFENFIKAIEDIELDNMTLKKLSNDVLKSSGYEKFNFNDLNKKYVENLKFLKNKIENGDQIEKTDIVNNTRNAWRPYKKTIEEWRTANFLKKSETSGNFSNLLEKNLIINISLLLFSAILIIVVSIVTIKTTLKTLAKFKNGLHNFFSYLRREKEKVEPIVLNSKDELEEIANEANNSIVMIERGIEQDKAFIKDVKIISEKMSEGHFSSKISSSADNPSLNELKTILCTLQSNIAQNIGDDLNPILKLLGEFDQRNFTNRLENAQGQTERIVNKLADTLKDILEESLKNAENLQDKATLMKNEMHELSAASQQQAASVEETSATMEEMSASISETNQMTKRVAEQSQDIKDVVNIIGDIADQINLLALNAAIEAARAGEHGRGFAVVADEVRKLAEKTQKSLNEIGANVNVLTQSIEEVEKAIEEQSQAIGSINGAIGEIDSATQKNAGITEEITQAANNVDELSKKMIDSVKKNIF